MGRSCSHEPTLSTKRHFSAGHVGHHPVGGDRRAGFRFWLRRALHFHLGACLLPRRPRDVGWRFPDVTRPAVSRRTPKLLTPTREPVVCTRTPTRTRRLPAYTRTSFARLRPPPGPAPCLAGRPTAEVAGGPERHVGGVIVRVAARSPPRPGSDSPFGSRRSSRAQQWCMWSAAPPPSPVRSWSDRATAGAADPPRPTLPDPPHHVRRPHPARSTRPAQPPYCPTPALRPLQPGLIETSRSNTVARSDDSVHRM